MPTERVKTHYRKNQANRKRIGSREHALNIGFTYTHLHLYINVQILRKEETRMIKKQVQIIRNSLIGFWKMFPICSIYLDVLNDINGCEWWSYVACMAVSSYLIFLVIFNISHICKSLLWIFPIGSFTVNAWPCSYSAYSLCVFLHQQKKFNYSLPIEMQQWKNKKGRLWLVSDHLK